MGPENVADDKKVNSNDDDTTPNPVLTSTDWEQCFEVYENSLELCSEKIKRSDWFRIEINKIALYFTSFFTSILNQSYGGRHKCSPSFG